jgi:hypothetical protein
MSSNTNKLPSMDDVPDFASYLHKNHKVDKTYGIPNMINQINDYALYVQYPNGYWNQYNKNSSNSHQLDALKEFIKSYQNSTTISVPHPAGGMFVATFTQKKSDDKNYNTIYSYKREDGQYVNFIVSYDAQIGFINRTSYEPIS